MTLQEMIDQIGDEIDDSSLAPQVTKAIQAAIRKYGRKKFWFNQKTITFSTVASQEYYDSDDESTIPDIIEILSMTVENSSYKCPMYSADFTAIDRAQSGLSISTPRNFAYFNSQIRMYPIPDTVYPIVAAVHYKLADLSLDQENAWTTDAEELIRITAKRILARDKTWHFEMYQGLALAEQEALTDLQAESARRLSNRQLVTDYPAGHAMYNIDFG